MQPRRRSFRPSHATAIAYLALFVALGGSSYAAIKVTGKNVKDRSLTAKDVKRNSLTGSEVKDRSLLSKDFKSGQLPAGPQGVKGDAGPAGPVAVPEAYHEVNTAGEPAFENSWTNENASTEATAGFYKDPFGVVRLKGMVTGGNVAPVFTLPTGYRPPKRTCFTATRNGTLAAVCINQIGAVSEQSGDSAGLMSLEGISFRAG